LSVLPHFPKNVISTEAAHAFVSSAVEKSASPPPPFANPRRCLCFSCCHRRLGSAVVSFLGLERGFSPASSQRKAATALPKEGSKPTAEATDLIAFAFAFIFLSAFSAQNRMSSPKTT
jgi:hypothetical protein